MRLITHTRRTGGLEQCLDAWTILPIFYSKRFLVVFASPLKQPNSEVIPGCNDNSSLYLTANLKTQHCLSTNVIIIFLHVYQIKFLEIWITNHSTLQVFLLSPSYFMLNHHFYVKICTDSQMTDGKRLTRKNSNQL
jgi:hypothetical protein